MVVCISQPRMFPCLSFLRRLSYSDIYVVMDNVQRVERGFENRFTLTHDGTSTKLISAPVIGSSRAAIDHCLLQDPNAFAEKLHAITSQYYRKAGHLREALDLIEGYPFSESYVGTLTRGLSYTIRFLDIRRPRFEMFSQYVDGPLYGKHGKEGIYNTVGKLHGKEYISGKHCLEYGMTAEECMRHGFVLNVDRWTPEIYNDSRDYMSVIHFVATRGREWTRDFIGGSIFANYPKFVL